MYLRDYVPALRYGAKILANEITGNFTFTGNTYYVKPYSGSNSNDGLTADTAFATLAKALSSATADNGDTVYLIAESNTGASTFDYLTAALDWNKDGVHLIGIGCEPFIGSRAGLRNALTATTIEDLFTVSADNCLIENISAFQGDVTSTATAPRAVVVSGMRNRFVNCQFSGNGDTGGSMDVAGARSLAVTGAENNFQHCYIGLDTVIRGTQTTEVYTTTGARNVFEDCMINSYTSLSTFKAITVGASDRFVLLKNCILNAVQNITSAVAPTGAIASGSVNGSVLVLGGGVFGYANVTTADDTKTLVAAPAGSLVDMGLGTAVDVA
jgi:hypothetical protein